MAEPRDTLEAVRVWMRGEDGPLYHQWEEGCIGNWYQEAWSWEETLACIESSDADVMTEPVPSTIVDLYRRIVQTLDTPTAGG